LLFDLQGGAQQWAVSANPPLDAGSFENTFSSFCCRMQSFFYICCPNLKKNTMNRLSNRVNYLAESETLAMTQRSRELQAQGHNVINLSIGEPDFNTPEFVKEAGKTAIDQNYTHYPPVSGYPELKKAICTKFKRDNNLDFTPNQIVVSTGAKQSIANAMLVLVNPGDDVLVPAPYWVSYRELIKLAEGNAVYINAGLENDFKITPAQLEAAITPRSRVFIFSSPCNPTGSVYTREELRGLAEVFERHPEIVILSDEIYEHINFVGKHESIAQFESIRDRVVVINGVSKGYAMTGWRIGFIGASLEIAKACDKIQGQVTSGTCSIAQRAALAALEPDPVSLVEMTEMREAFRKRRDLLISLLNEIPGVKTNVPPGAFYVFPDVSHYYGKSVGDYTINDGNDLCMYILDTVFVALVPGTAFGSNNCIRFSYAASEEQLVEAVRRVKTALEKLN
jgi:aspartate aminotransferase